MARSKGPRPEGVRIKIEDGWWKFTPKIKELYRAASSSAIIQAEGADTMSPKEVLNEIRRSGLGLIIEPSGTILSDAKPRMIGTLLPYASIYRSFNTQAVLMALDDMRGHLVPIEVFPSIVENLAGYDKKLIPALAAIFIRYSEVAEGVQRDRAVAFSEALLSYLEE